MMECYVTDFVRRRTNLVEDIAHIAAAAAAAAVADREVDSHGEEEVGFGAGAGLSLDSCSPTSSRVEVVASGSVAMERGREASHY